MKRALVVGSGGLWGAYTAGVLATLGRRLGPGYFNAVYASSVGAYVATVLVANQPDMLESTWRNSVDGRKLFDLTNLFRHKGVLKLEYLTQMTQNDATRLDVEAIMRSSTRLIYALTQYPEGNTVYMSPDRNNIFELMEASSAIPLAHKPVEIDGRRYVDGALADPLPVTKALEDGFDEILVVSNHPKGSYVGRFYKFYELIAPLFLPRQILPLVKNHKEKIREIEHEIENNPRISLIRPAERLPQVFSFDTRKRNINKAVDMGINDAEIFLKQR